VANYFSETADLVLHKVKGGNMVTPIARVVTEVAATQPRNSGTTTETVHEPARVAPSTDTVKLSADAQIHLLQTQGQTIDQIAVTLNLSPQLVATYLGTTPLQLAALSSVK
jgi:hypothetical protein